MSTRPHILLSWTVRRTRLPLLTFRCVHCHSGLASTGEGKSRVNANGKLLHIWLLVACVSCDRTSRITVHDRVPVRSPPESPWPVQVPVIFDEPVPPSPRTAHRPGAGHQPRGDRSSRQDRHSAEPQNSQGLLDRPAMSRRRGPEPGREARWPCPGLHHAAVRARSLMTGRERGSGPARYRRRR
ncbi:DUF1062 domain-containing protein [Micromonospora sp. NPDC007271]|uniref:DUF1062 domain-containing protein n=1 Tax=Micromonospora sp. NPDC007271 TaxID=3154587 RepID=UPI0033EB5322